MANELGEWDVNFTPESLQYIATFASDLKQYVKDMGMDETMSIAVAGAVAREETANKLIYPYSIWRGLANKLITGKDYLESLTHAQLLESYNKFQTTASSFEPVATDAYSVGKIRVATAISLLNRYKVTNPGDELKLSRYYNDYHQFVVDLDSHSSDTALKIATLVIKDSKKDKKELGTVTFTAPQHACS
jgi:hypothetical protein